MEQVAELTPETKAETKAETKTEPRRIPRTLSTTCLHGVNYVELGPIEQGHTEFGVYYSRTLRIEAQGVTVATTLFGKNPEELKSPKEELFFLTR